MNAFRTAIDNSGQVIITFVGFAFKESLEFLFYFKTFNIEQVTPFVEFRFLSDFFSEFFFCFIVETVRIDSLFLYLRFCFALFRVFDFKESCWRNESYRERKTKRKKKKKCSEPIHWTKRGNNWNKRNWYNQL